MEPMSSKDGEAAPKKGLRFAVAAEDGSAKRVTEKRELTPGCNVTRGTIPDGDGVEG